MQSLVQTIGSVAVRSLRTNVASVSVLQHNISKLGSVCHYCWSFSFFCYYFLFNRVSSLRDHRLRIRNFIFTLLHQNSTYLALCLAVSPVHGLTREWVRYVSCFRSPIHRWASYKVKESSITMFQDQEARTKS